MSIQSSHTEPSYFGKNSFVPFIGQVEDVDDPKRSGRVKVRFLGWSPNEKKGEGLATEDLPWARVAMPPTHAQQMRVGGKHGLIAGSMVIGFFLDGLDANQPVVLATFNHTAKASEKNNREQVDVGTGKIPEDTEGQTKIDPITSPNTGINTKVEIKSGKDDEGDVAHDVTLDDSTDGGSCVINKSAFSEDKPKPKTASNTSSQNYDTQVADGLCGPLSNGRAIISSKIKEWMPDGVDKVIDGSNMFDNNGNIVNVNALINRLALKISSIMRGALNAKKAETQKFINKILHSTGLLAGASRSPLTAQLADLTLSIKFDLFNEMIDKFIEESLDQLVTESLQSLYNQKFTSKDIDNLTGEYGSAGVSVLLDLDSTEIADSVIADIDLAYSMTQDDATRESQEYVSEAETKIVNFNNNLRTMSSEDFTCEDDMNETIETEYKEVEDTVNNLLSNPLDQLGAINFGDISGILKSVLNMDFTLNPAIFNRSGLAILSAITQEGCSPHDMINTMEGYIGSIAGVGGKSTGAGSESGKSSKNYKDCYSNVGLVGKPGVESTLEESTNTPLSGSPRIKKIKQSLRKKILDSILQFTPVDYFQEGRTYEFKGEVVFDGKETNNSRVLVNNQQDPSENGIYLTSRYEWIRAGDADKPSDFKRKKVAVVKSMSEISGLYYYSGKQNPKVGYDDIEYLNVHTSKEFTQDEKDALNHLVEIEPDGSKGSFFAVSLPSSNKEAATNYVYGIPNAIIISNPGENYFFESKDPRRQFPSIFIERYAGTPTPVVDPNSGELVSILINYNSFGMDKANPSTSVFADDSSIGISTEDPNYDVVLSGFYITNTGNGYDKNTTIHVIDKDRDLETAVVRPVVRDGRITRIEVINNGKGFKRIPKISITNTGGGKGLKLYPIMGLKAKVSDPSVKQLEQNIALGISPSPTNVNLYTTIKDIPEDTITISDEIDDDSFYLLDDPDNNYITTESFDKLVLNYE